MRGAEAIHAFKLDDQNAFNDQIRLEFADELTLVGDGIRDLGDCGDTSKGQLVHEGTLVQLFQKAGTQGIGDFIGRSNDGFSEGVQVHSY